jgi:DNA-binding MarR family transcriptional regulator
MEHYGLGSAHVICICLLGEHPKGLTKTELAKRGGVDKAQISRVISDVLEKDYVSVSNPQASYRQRYTLTELGATVANEIRKTILDINSFVSESIPKEDIDVFYSTFNTICENLNKAEKQFDL